MMTVVVNYSDSKKWAELEPDLLVPVYVEYYKSAGACEPMARSTFLVPANTNIKALEHMLALWSVLDNDRELPVSPGGNDAR